MTNESTNIIRSYKNCKYTTKNTHNDSQHTDSNSCCTLIDIQNLPRIKNLFIWGKIAKSSAEKEKMNRKILDEQRM